MKIPKPNFKSQKRLIKKIENKALILWKEVCFKNYGRKCEICGGTFRITPHHYFYRSSVPHLKYEPLNGVILCCKCHSQLHFRDPKLMEELIVRERGKKWLTKLTALKAKPPKFKDIKYYENLCKKLSKLR